MADSDKKFQTPFSREMERAVIGSVILDSLSAMGKVRHILTYKDFYFSEHRILFKAFEEMYSQSMAIDVLTLTDWLRSHELINEIGGENALTELPSDVPSPARVAQYAKRVAKYATLRRILDAARDIGRLTQKDDLDMDTLLQEAENRLKGVTREAQRSESRLELADLNEWMQIARNDPAPAGQIRGLSTGLQKVDRMTQGFVPGELMIISGQTSHGKTQLSNNIMLKAARADHKVGFITMEMTKREVGERFNLLTNDEDIGEGKVLLNMHADLSHQDVTQMIERLKERGVGLVVIDHLHYFSRSVDNPGQEISKIVKEFKGAAVKYELPIILICHVRKMPPKQHPSINDLRDSSMIAQDADIVLIVWRDETPNAKNPNEVEVVLWKNRNRQKKHRREYLFAQGMQLVEEDPRPLDDKERQRLAANQARLLGERDLDEDEDEIEEPIVLDLPW